MQQIKTFDKFAIASFLFLCEGGCSLLEMLLATSFFILSLEFFFEMQSAVLNSPATKLYFNYFPCVLY